MSKQPLNQLLSQAKYKHITHARQDILNATKTCKSISPRLEKYIFPNGLAKDLVCLDGTIPVTFRDATYNIPVGIFISDCHPIEAPICYVRPTEAMTIKKSRHVDDNGRVYLPYLSEWNKNTSDILGLIQVMQIVFGQACPVYQKINDTPVATSVAMPPALPTSYSYTGTLTEDQIRASRESAVKDHIRTKTREKISQLQDEIKVLKKTSDDLNRGKEHLDEMKTRMPEEIQLLVETKNKLENINEQLQEFIEKYTNEHEEIDIDGVYVPTQPLYNQLLEAVVEDRAVADTIYKLGEFLQKGVISLDVFLKKVRELSRDQFMARATILACRQKAGLPN